MRIQNNITAMNTHRQYTINNDNVAKSAEKLSSGYRINRAGDDAAGLAISEKMRSQIRGLNMATKNSQDAISLVQTAEGALQETQNMLQRMNELAVQAATGTNETLDRNALAKEFEQLKREINDIAEQTTFNNMKILDGSMSYGGYIRSAQTAGVTSTVENITSSGSGAVTAAGSKDAVAGEQQIEKKQGEVVVSGSKYLAENGLTATGSKEYTIDLGLEGVGPITIDAGSVTTSKSLGEFIADNITKSAIPASFKFSGTTEEQAAQKAKLQEAMANYTVTYQNSNLKFEEKAAAAGQGTLGEIKPTITATEYKKFSGGDAATATGNTAGSKAEIAFADKDATGGTGAAILGTTSADKQTYRIELTQGTTTANTKVRATIEVTGDGKTTIGELINKAYGDNNILEIATSVDADGNATATGKFNVKFDTTDGLKFTALDDTTTLNPGTSFKLTMASVDTPESPTTGSTPGADGTQVGHDATAASKTYDIKFPTGEAGETGVLKVGEKLTVDGQSYTFSDKAVDKLGANEFSDLDSLIKAINDNDGKVFASRVQSLDKDGNPVVDDAGNAVYEDGKIQISQAVKDVATEAEWKAGTKFTEFHTDADLTLSNGSADKKTTVEFEFGKLQNGDEITIKVAGYDDIKVSKSSTDTRASFMKKVDEAVKEATSSDSRIKVNGNALIAAGIDVESIELTKDGLEGKDTNAIRIQVGALEDEQLSVSIDSMNTKGLGLDDAFLMSQDNPMNAATLDQDAAGAAITKVRDAINKVSDQRATLGAMQNRLDHKIANLKVSSENLSAAESRIRDVDMAQEMTNFTKNQILSQAATAMLAQANSLPQNVLSLLG